MLMQYIFNFDTDDFSHTNILIVYCYRLDTEDKDDILVWQSNLCSW